MIQNYCKKRGLKKLKKKGILIVGIILIVAVIIAISLFGINIKDKEGLKRDIIPGYKMGMEFTKARKIIATVNDGISSQRIFDKDGNEVTEKQEGVEYTEENGYRIEETKVNPDDTRTLENYKKSKEVLQNKIKNLKIPEYILSLNEDNGEITIRIPEDDEAGNTENLIQKPGSLVFIDMSKFEVVFNREYVKSAKTVASQGNMESAIFLQIDLTEEGINKLNELKEIYKETTEEVTNEDGTKENKVTQNEVLVMLNGMSLGTTILENITYDNKIMIPFAVSNNTEELKAGLNDAEIEAAILNAGITPITYSYSEEVVEAEMTLENILYCLGVIFIISVVAFVFLIIRFKAKGFISMYFQIGFFAVLLLIMRLTNVKLTMEGIAGIIVSIIMNYIFNYIMLKNIKEPNMYKIANLSFLFYTVPVFIIAIMFTFSNIANIASFGMTTFWGIIMTYIYNFIFSKYVFENLTGGKNESSKNNN